MKRVIIAALAAAAVALGVVGAALASTMSGAAAARHSRTPVAYNGADGWSGGAARPPAIYIGGSDVFVRALRWSHWTARSATARGALWVDTCSPTCAAGRYRIYPAVVRLWRAVAHKGAAYFSRMSLSYVHGQQRHYTYVWGVLPGATIPGWNGGPARPATA